MTAGLLVSASAILGGCFQTNQPGQGELFLSADAVAAKDDEICRGYGAKPGTPEYINCRGQQDVRRTQWKTAN
ncbi:hypothetical protein JQ628_02180 [Bradyrhizobium lablabi]|nr:hypothetical protein [Bradyrhizobium lablabi]